jgi:hypothetical protein
MTDSPQHRRRPWYRPRNVIPAVLLAALAVLTWAFFETWKVYRSEPSPGVNYRAEFRAYAEQTHGVDLERADRAWTALVAALESVSSINAQIRCEIEAGQLEVPSSEDAQRIYGLDFERIRCGASPPNDIELELEALRRYREADVFTLLTEHAHYAPGLCPAAREVSMLSVAGSDQASARSVACVLAALMRLNAVDGRQEVALRYLDDALAIGQTIAHQPDRLSWPVGMGIHDLLLGELRYELLESLYGESHYPIIMDILDRRRLPSLPFALEAYRHVAYDTLEWATNKDGYLILPQFYELLQGGSDAFSPSLLFAFRERFLLPRKGHFRVLIDEWTDAYLREAERLPVRRWQGNFEPGRFLDALDLPSSLIVESWLLSRQGFLLERGAMEATIRAGTRLMLAIHEDRERIGEYPDSLDQLVPSVIEELPADPLHGGAFRYRRISEDPAGREYLLYSIGMDEIDNNGTILIWQDTGRPAPYMALAETRPDNIDCVINMPRPRMSDDDADR